MRSSQHHPIIELLSVNFQTDLHRMWSLVSVLFSAVPADLRSQSLYQVPFLKAKAKKKETKASRKTKSLPGRTALAVRYQLGKAEGPSSSLYQVPLNFSQSSNFETNKSETLSGYRAWDRTVPTQHQAAEQTKDSWWAKLLHRKHVGTLKYRVCGHQSQIKSAKKAAQTGRVVTQRLNKLLWDSELICSSPVSAA